MELLCRKLLHYSWNCLHLITRSAFACKDAMYTCLHWIKINCIIIFVQILNNIMYMLSFLFLFMHKSGTVVSFLVLRVLLGQPSKGRELRQDVHQGSATTDSCGRCHSTDERSRWWIWRLLFRQPILWWWRRSGHQIIRIKSPLRDTGYSLVFRMKDLTWS